MSAVTGLRPEQLAALERAGMYDPKAPNAPERRALIEWLFAQGATLDEILKSRECGTTLTGLAGDLALRSPGESLTLPEVAARAGLAPERIERLLLAAGLPPIDPTEARFSADDATAFVAFDQGAALFGETAILEFVRVIGSSLARIAEAAVSLFLVNIEGPIRSAAAGELALAKANLMAIQTFGVVGPAIQSMLRSQVQLAIRRMRTARDEYSVDLVRMAIGFVDLVGFTSLSRKLTARELAEVVAQFEGRAHDIVTVRDGRLVKLIGDEVMFVAHAVATACDIALTLVEAFADDVTVMPRGGLAAGPLIMRSGDYYGPIVNLASRIADLAVPDEVLVSADVAAQACNDRLQFEPAGKRMLKGFDEPVLLYAVRRA